jgi:hypothetical protein
MISNPRNHIEFGSTTVLWKRMNTQCASVAIENNAQQKGYPNREVYTTEHRGPSGIPASFGGSSIAAVSVPPQK